jgi:hypothetical protein
MPASRLAGVHAPLPTLAVVLTILAAGFAVAAVVRSSADRATLSCDRLSESVVACAEQVTPPRSFGSCEPYGSRGDVVIWTCRN